MNFPYYTGKPENRRIEGAANIVSPSREKQTDPAGYKPDDGLVDAANVALLLGKPLLLTGEPGTGKSQFASSLAWELGFGEPLIFETKSSSVSSDLFYRFETLRRFHEALLGKSSGDSLAYLIWHALGTAILQSHPKEKVVKWLNSTITHIGPRRSVVLIDEIDKAPRDFPNDLLNEIEKLYFRVPEISDETIKANEDFRPILVLTSNSEKGLPEAFLRRCVYYNIEFPQGERLAEIVKSRVTVFENISPESKMPPMLKDALELFAALREKGRGIGKIPATAELIDWLVTLDAHGIKAEQSLREHRNAVLGSLSALIKKADDQTTAKAIVEKWLNANA